MRTVMTGNYRMQQGIRSLKSGRNVKTSTTLLTGTPRRVALLVNTASPPKRFLNGGW
ncbi:hypothetical protein AGABI2DRAFT_192063 [Agaricus bisporus var. bisporus H97]|uniref:hypothetical protein n=1 Tax=Agaricus bisporus var. bisporus (strain H97 / ATCC MYA-4626 / FGSC 10389) TaxID=936046 RepID=UPI00029F7FD6|nr:hypothetical protein AGABI2DRAFT_192063 [Agaricus bisporus var. bisporus H97]EKV48456.1 hypothetical protein AGABI2DRAFT_192063 [Agaricus bisporus var. bisporus H97]